jgi:galactokinase/mevalonate kinase-like predicted kinase
LTILPPIFSNLFITSYFFSEPEKKYEVMNKLENIGGKIVNFHFNPKGLETWKYGF